MGGAEMGINKLAYLADQESREGQKAPLRPALKAVEKALDVLRLLSLPSTALKLAG